MASAGGEGAPPMLTTLSVFGAGDAALACATAAPGAARRIAFFSRGELTAMAPGLVLVVVSSDLSNR